MPPRPPTEADWSALRGRLGGNLATGAAVRGIYATDASVYQVMPQAVAFPRHAGDARAVVAFAAAHGVPLTGRGGGTSLSGQAIGPGIVVDFSRHMNKVLEVAPDGAWARVEPGVVLDELNRQLRPHGTHFAPDPATGSRATVGGMIGNNSCGTRSIVHGRTADSLLGARLLLADGQELVLSRGEDWAAACARTDFHGDLHLAVDRLRKRHADAIAAGFPKLPRVVAGYALDKLQGPQANLLDLLCGAEGTLGLVLEATVRLIPLPQATSLVVVGFDNLDDALVPLPRMLTHGPSAIELLDTVVISEAVRNPATRDLAAFLQAGGAVPFAVQMVEFFGDEPAQAAARAEAFVADCRTHGIGAAHHLFTDPAAQHAAWEVRRLGLGLISNQPGKAKGISAIEDACVPVEKLAEYTRFVYACCARHGVHTATYAHASVGVLHFKAMLDLHQDGDRRALRKVMEECFAECKRLGGVFSGEHGDGIVRGEFVGPQFGPELLEAFRALKTIFDPANLMNPGRKLDAPPLDGPLRYGANPDPKAAGGGAPRDYPLRIAGIQGHFRHAAQEGIVGAIEQCNGVGACRKLGSGTMCPSYRATLDEAHSTRGRANALRLAISGQLNGRIGAAGLADPGLHQTLDLCLSCKACKAECPNAVDMARLKSEALQAKWDAEGTAPWAKLTGRLPDQARRFGGSWLGFVGGALANSGPGRRYLHARHGMDPRRPLPALAGRTLDQLLAERGLSRSGDRRTVALFADTWMRFFDPQLGLAAVELLESCRINVRLTRSHDGLRPRLSAGLLREAKERGARLFGELRRFAAQDVPVLCLEPSEASAIKDDLPDLLDPLDADGPSLEETAANVHLLDDFLAAEVKAGLALKPVLAVADGPLLLHPHCHQRAIFSAAAPKAILEAAGFKVEAPDTGCCGMAGSFGHTHHDLSLKIGGERLFPAARRMQDQGGCVVATGTSCRQQLQDGPGIRARHWVELVRGA